MTSALRYLWRIPILVWGSVGPFFYANALQEGGDTFCCAFYYVIWGLNKFNSYLCENFLNVEHYVNFYSIK